MRTARTTRRSFQSPPLRLPGRSSSSSPSSSSSSGGWADPAAVNGLPDCLPQICTLQVFKHIYAVAWLCSLLLIPPPLHSHRTLNLPQAQISSPEESHDQRDQSEPVQELHQRERGEFSFLHPGSFGFFDGFLLLVVNLHFRLLPTNSVHPSTLKRNLITLFYPTSYLRTLE